MLLVVGLGNPGREYASHRHTVGFMAVDELARRVNADPFREKFSGVVARAELGGQQAILLKPMTYMNESGRSVQPALAFYKVTPREMIVIHDELDLPFNDVRIKFAGGHAGHNGLRSIIAHIGTGDFGRVRVGIGRPPPGFRGEVADYVLSNFDPIERASLPDGLKVAVESVLDIAARGIEAAMNARNIRPKQAKPKAKGRGEGDGEPAPQHQNKNPGDVAKATAPKQEAAEEKLGGS
jgi:peptidyl-tRNA hydrolase, PTH1 family